MKKKKNAHALAIAMNSELKIALITILTTIIFFAALIYFGQPKEKVRLNSQKETYYLNDSTYEQVYTYTIDILVNDEYQPTGWRRVFRDTVINYPPKKKEDTIVDDLLDVTHPISPLNPMNSD
jgi:hypothetical protein